MTTDPRNRQQALLGVALAVVALVSVIGWRATGEPAVRAAAIPTTADLVPLTAFLARSSDSAAAFRGADTLFVRRDPFGATTVDIVPTVAHETPAFKSSDSELVINAVLITDFHKAAVINDALVTLGDTVAGGGRLTAVESDRVVVTDSRGVRRTFSVKEGNP